VPVPQYFEGAAHGGQGGIEGSGKQVKGSVKEKAGELLGDKKHEERR
jgi:uncharacterized protein YjbJ (UPF0337 family)